MSAALHRRRRLVAETDRQQLTPTTLQDPRRNGGAVRRCPEALTSTVEIASAARSPADAQADLRASRSRGSNRRTRKAASVELRRQLRKFKQPLRCTASQAPPRRTTVRGWRSSSTLLPENYAGYFLIVADFIKHAKSKAFGWSRRVPVPVRWSLVLTITISTHPFACCSALSQSRARVDADSTSISADRRGR